MSEPLTEGQVRQMVTDLNSRLSAVEAFALPRGLAQLSQRLTALEALELSTSISQTTVTVTILEGELGNRRIRMCRMHRVKAQIPRRAQMQRDLGIPGHPESGESKGRERIQNVQSKAEECL